MHLKEMSNLFEFMHFILNMNLSDLGRTYPDTMKEKSITDTSRKSGL